MHRRDGRRPGYRARDDDSASQSSTARGRVCVSRGQGENSGRDHRAIERMTQTTSRKGWRAGLDRALTPPNCKSGGGKTGGACPTPPTKQQPPPLASQLPPLAAGGTPDGPFARRCRRYHIGPLETLNRTGHKRTHRQSHGRQHGGPQQAVVPRDAGERGVCWIRRGSLLHRRLRTHAQQAPVGILCPLSKTPHRSISPHRTPSQEIQGVPTDLVVMSFADRIMVTLSQSGKFGTLVRSFSTRYY